MQQRHSKVEEAIEAGVGALRSEQSPSADPDAVLAAMRAPRKGRRLVMTSVTVGACALAAIAIVTWPRESTAADLGAVEKALENAPQRIETHYVADQDGTYKWKMQVVVDRDKAKLEEDGAATLVWERDRMTTYFDDFAIKSMAVRPHWAQKSPTLEMYLKEAVPGTVRSRIVWKEQVRGAAQFKRELTQVDFDVVVRDAIGKDLPGHIVLDFDRVTYLPVTVRAELTGFQPIQIRYEYKLSDIKVDYSIPRPVRVYDIDAQRKEILDSFTSPVATADAGGGKVLLHAAVVDHEGNVTFIYSDVPELPAVLDKSKVLDPEMQAEGPTLAMMPQTTREGTVRDEPVLFNGRRVALLSLKLKANFAEVDTLAVVKLPIVVNGVEQWAEFHDVPLLRTGDSLMLLAPRNVPFFIEQSGASGGTTSN